MKKYWVEISLGIIMFIFFPILTTIILGCVVIYYHTEIQTYIKFEIMLWDSLTHYSDTPNQRKFIMDAIDSGKKLNKNKLEKCLKLINTNLEKEKQHHEQIKKESRKSEWDALMVDMSDKTLKRQNSIYTGLCSYRTDAYVQNLEYFIFKCQYDDLKFVEAFCKREGISHIETDFGDVNNIIIYWGNDISCEYAHKLLKKEGKK